MMNEEDRPLIVQEDRTVLVDVDSDANGDVRHTLSHFANVHNQAGVLHTYYLSNHALWHAVYEGWTSEKVCRFFERYSKIPVSHGIKSYITETMNQVGQIWIDLSAGKHWLYARSKSLLQAIVQCSGQVVGQNPAMIQTESNGYWRMAIHPNQRGTIKQCAAEIGYPVHDYVPHEQGDGLPFSLRNGEEKICGETRFQLRDYQLEAVRAYTTSSRSLNGQGVIVLPCGAGKTIVGMAVMHHYQCATLIVTNNQTSARQWRNELLQKTTLPAVSIGLYMAASKEVAPVTITTYNMLSYRQKDGQYPHLGVFEQRKWGLIIYDEVHFLPAPVFRISARVQSIRRIGLTATLVREDGKENDVYALIGPKIYDCSWKDLERKAYIARAICIEIRVELPMSIRQQMLRVNKQSQARICQENPRKLWIVQQLLKKHANEKILIIGQYVQQMEQIGNDFGIPTITGKTPHAERDLLYDQFRQNHIRVLVVSKVANYALDLPDARVAIQLSGAYGSRQEEAQRLGRILRRKAGTAYFYHIVSGNSPEEKFARKRQRYLMQQGYEYKYVDESNFMERVD